MSPKPFLWIPVPQQAPRKQAPVGLEVFRNLTGRLDLSLVVESAYFYVGSGAYEYKAGARPNEPEVWHTFARREGQLCIPGTSLKGAIRAFVELLSNSCVSQAGRQEFVPMSHKQCPESAGEICVACSLFGRTGWRGRIHFADATPAAEVRTQIVKINELWAPRRTQGRKFYSGNQYKPLSNLQPERNHRFVEAVTKGGRFNTAIFFENVRAEELGLVCCALGWDVGDKGTLVTAYYPKIGGAKPRCFGMVRFASPVVNLWGVSSGSLLPSRTQKTGKDALDYIAQCIAACKKNGPLVLDAWKRLVEGLRAGTACPEGLY
ncbi:hypothetical protein HRbin36_01324 [bacterium HR36]|nr:hypothetical protein HRbin36_01324 [bacterium HR36]